MFGKLIREYRKATGKTQEEMAYLLDISANHLSRMERGITAPSSDLIKRIINIITSDDCLLSCDITTSTVASLILLIHLNKLPGGQRKLVIEETLHYINFINQTNVNK